MKDRGRLATEFILIVLGVLVALMVDAWLESRRDSELRQEYLTRLADDISVDVSNLDQRILFFRQVAIYGMDTIAWIKSDDPPSHDVLSAAFFAAEVWPYEPIQSTYFDLQSTGNIRLLDDIDMRMSLAAYHSASERRQSGWDLPEEYREIVRGLIPPPVQAAIRNSCLAISVDINEGSTLAECGVPDVTLPEFSASLEALRAYPEVERILRYRVSEVDTSIILFETQQALASPILEAINAKISGE